MSNSTNNSAQTNASDSSTGFFDLHASAFGYLNRYRVIGSGKKQFCAVTVAALRGSKDEVEYTYFDTIIRNQDVCALLAEYSNQINDRNIKVLANVTVSDFYAADPWQKNGKWFGSIKGRLIALKTLVVEGKTVFNSKPVESVSDEPEQDASSIDSQMDQVVSEFSEPSSEPNSASVPEVIRSVRLDPSIEFYEAQKQDLMSKGYVFDSEQGRWVLYQSVA